MLVVARFYSPRHAARAGWAVAFLVPTWLALVVGAADINVRCVVALMAVAVVVVKPRLFTFVGLSWIDLLPMVIVVTGAISTTLNDRFSPTIIFGLFAQWLFPYVLARLILIRDQDAVEFIPLAATLTLILAGAMIFESVADINIFNRVLGHEGSTQGDLGHRLGLKRAEACTGIPVGSDSGISRLLGTCNETLARRSSDLRHGDFSATLTRSLYGFRRRDLWSCLVLFSTRSAICNLHRYLGNCY